MKIRLIVAIITFLFTFATSYAINGNDVTFNISECPTHVISTKKHSWVVVTMFERDSDGRRHGMYVMPGDSVYSVESVETLDLSDYEREHKIVGLVKGKLCLINKDWADELVWQNGEAINLREYYEIQKEKEKTETFEKFTSLVNGPNLINGNFWYYLLAILSSSIVCFWMIKMAFKNLSAGKSCFKIWTFVAAAFMIAMYIFQFSVAYFGMEMMSDWLRPSFGNEFGGFLLMIPKSLGIVILVIYQFIYWSKLMGLLGLMARGRTNFGFTFFVIILGTISIIICILFAKRHLMTVLSIMGVLLCIDLLITVFRNRKSLSVAMLSIMLTAVGMVAMVEMLMIFGLVFVAIFGAVLIGYYFANGMATDYAGKFTTKYDVYSGVTKVGKANAHGDVSLNSMGRTLLNDGEHVDLVERK